MKSLTSLVYVALGSSLLISVEPYKFTKSARLAVAPEIVRLQTMRGFRRYNFGLPLPPPVCSDLNGNDEEDDLVGFSMLRLPPGLRETIISSSASEIRYIVENPGWRTFYPSSKHEGVITFEGEPDGGTMLTWSVAASPLPGARPFVSLMTSVIVSAAFNYIVVSSAAANDPDYLITDSLSLEMTDRPSLPSTLTNPRDILACCLLCTGLAISALNVFGVYGELYLRFSAAAIFLGVASGIAGFLQITTGYLITRHDRPGIADDAAVNLYGAAYSSAVTWLALRASELCPGWLATANADRILGPLAVSAFLFGVTAPVKTLLTSTDLSQTELLRVRGLVAIGFLGVIFTPDAVAFFLGSEAWWGRVTHEFASQKTLESSTSLFALFATEASMVAHRAGKAGVAPYRDIVPAFVVVCFVLAILPCVCALNNLGDDISFFSFYTS